MSSRTENCVGDALEELYRRYTCRAFVEPDPIQFLYRYDDARDREVAGLLAAGVAYGRVQQIVHNVGAILGRLGSSPASRLRDASDGELCDLTSGFRHRWSTAEEMRRLFVGIRGVLGRYESLGACFRAGMSLDARDTTGGLTHFVKELGLLPGERNSLLPAPALGSACKRLHMYLRWMVRRDAVDPGGWDVSAACLVVPLDTHMHQMALMLGLTGRKQADLRTAQEITDGFRRYAPEDPVRYDFALTRLGIRRDLDREEFFRRCNVV